MEEKHYEQDNPTTEAKEYNKYGLTSLHYRLIDRIGSESDKSLYKLLLADESNYEAEVNLPIGDNYSSYPYSRCYGNIYPGLAPLHICAALAKPADVAIWLMSKGANVNARDNQGNTPLDICVKSITIMPPTGSYSQLLKHYLPLMIALARCGGKLSTQYENFRENKELIDCINKLSEQHGHSVSELGDERNRLLGTYWSAEEWLTAFYIGHLHAHSDLEKHTGQAENLKSLAHFISTLPNELKEYLASFRAQFPVFEPKEEQQAHINQSREIAQSLLPAAEKEKKASFVHRLGAKAKNTKQEMCGLM